MYALSDFQDSLNLKDIFPEVYWTVQAMPDEKRQEVLILGMLDKAILLDILKTINATERILLLIDEAHRTQGAIWATISLSAFPMRSKLPLPVRHCLCQRLPLPDRI